jgi:hypothetical protein
MFHNVLQAVTGVTAVLPLRFRDAIEEMHVFEVVVLLCEMGLVESGKREFIGCFLEGHEASDIPQV